MSGLVDAVVVILQVLGVAAVAYGLFLKLSTDITPAKKDGLASSN